MSLSFEFKQSLKFRKRRSRRFRVLTFFGLVVMGLSFAGKHWSLSWLPLQFLTYGTALADVYSRWEWSQYLKVSSLDDRASFEYGKEFDQLDKEEKESILKRYRVGTYVVNYFADERQRELNRDANMRAHQIIRLLFPAIAIVYWAGWKFLPESRLRAGWTDGPVIMFWLGLLVIALPRIIVMWNEPDEIGEPQIVQSGPHAN